MKATSILSSSDATAAVNSVPFDLGDLDTFSVQVLFGANSATSGTLLLQASDDNLNWIDVSGSSQAVAVGANHLWNVNGAGYRHVRAKWTPTTNTLKNWTAAGVGPYTVTVTHASHGLSNGMLAKISSSTFAGMDGEQTITDHDANTFEFEMVADPGAAGTLSYAGSGTISASLVGKEPINRQ